MTKEELREYRQLKKELAALEVLARKIERHGTDELLSFYEEKREKLAAELLRIEAAIETLDSVEKTLVRLRYIDGLSWQAICFRISYSWRQTHRIHASALIKLRDK